LPSRGKLYVVGIGPGCVDLLTLKAKRVIENSDYVIGHKTYLNLIRNIIKGKVIESEMGREIERVKLAIELAKNSVVCLVSGGDPNIYGIAPLVVEYIYLCNNDNNNIVDFEIVSGVTALSIASILLGSAISGDHAVISLSDLLTPWRIIENRLKKALEGDFVIAIYNPSSRRRRTNLEKALKIIMEYRGDIRIGVVKNACRDGEEVRVMRCGEILSSDVVDMHTILIIPNSESVVNENVIITPRGYSRKYELR